MKRILKKITKDLNLYRKGDDFLLNLLRFFEKMHWISLISDKTREFVVEIEEEKKEYLWMIETLNGYGKMSKNENIYQFEER